jgi:hypothetical protein
MQRPTVWKGFIFPWIALALTWAQFAPYWGFGGSYSSRLIVGLAGGVVAAGLEFFLLHRIINGVQRRLARHDPIHTPPNEELKPMAAPSSLVE